MRVVLVYDRVNKIGGAERVLLALHEIYPEAPLFTAIYDSKRAKWADVFKVFPSFINKLPLVKSNHELFPWLMPVAFENFNFDSFDVVISVTSAEAKGIITKPKTMHICYCLTPTRYLWSHSKEYLENPGFGLLNPLARMVSKFTFNYLRKWDKAALHRPDYYIAISKNVRERIKKYYNREAEVIYPPVNINKFQISNYKSPRKNFFEILRDKQINSKFQIPNNNKNHETFFLVVSRLVAYKRIDLVIKAFNKLGKKLIIVGTGREEKRLKRIAGKNIEFLGELTDERLISYYQECQALIFPQNEDFGLSAVEVQACGCPVIAYKKGGALEIIKEGVTGEFFYPQNTDVLIDIIKNFKKSKYNPKDCRDNAKRFDKSRFKMEFRNKINSYFKDYSKGEVI